MKNQLLFLLLSLSITFSLKAQYQLNGTATQLDEDCVQLTDALNTQSGSMWFLEQISLAEDFSLDFDIFLGCNDSGGADGIAFVLQPISTSLGASGGGLGFDGISPSVGIEFDTWQNNEYSDPTYDHIAVMQNGIIDHLSGTLAGPEPISPDEANVEDCEYHNIRITWNATSQTLSAYFECQLRIQYTGDLINDFFDSDPNVFWGFTAATGAANNVHQICLDYVSFTDQLEDATICEGDSYQVQFPDNFATYFWEPTNGLSENFIPNPIASPTETTTYVLTVLDECANGFSDTITINVLASGAELELGEPIELCPGESAVIDGTVPGATEYAWSTGSQEATITVTEPGFYSVSVGLDCGGVADEVEVLEASGTLDINLGDDIQICQGESVSLDATLEGATSYNWSNGSTEPVIIVDEAGSYNVSVLSDCGEALDTIEVSIISVADNLDLGQDLQLCFGETAQIDGNFEGAESYQWSNGSTEASIEVVEAGLYSLTVNTLCGTFNDEVLVSLGTAAEVDLGDYQTFCSEEAAILDGTTSGATTYLWNTGATSPTISITQSGIYSVTISGDCGTSTDDVCVLYESCAVQCANMQITQLVDCNPNTLEYEVYSNIVGGTPPYTITGAYNGTITENNTVFQIGPLAPSSIYQFDVIDATGCLKSALGKPECTTLPVELIQFEGKQLANGNLLSWDIASELNCDYYLLERSYNGTEFEKIHTENGNGNGNGNSNQFLSYSHLDQAAKKGLIYYRLSQFDYDGTGHRLGQISLVTEDENGLQIELIQSNSNQAETLEVSAFSPVTGPLHLRIYDITGRLISLQTHDAEQGWQQLQIDRSKMNKGIYFIDAQQGQNRIALSLWAD